MTREDERHAVWKSEAESLGEFKVRMSVSRLPPLSDDRLKFFDAWLAAQDADRRDAREEKTLRVAARANIIAWIAAAIATMSIIKDIIFIVVDKTLK